MFSIENLVYVFLMIVGAGLIFWMLHWLVTQLGLPEPFNKAARIILAVFAVLFLIGIILSLINGNSPTFRLN